MLHANRHAIRRFAVKSAILVVYALLQWRGGFLRALSTLFILTAVIDIGIALHSRERFRDDSLGYWDEAAASLLVGLVSGLTAA